MRQSPSIPRGFVGSLGDKKFLDTANATYPLNSTGSITHLTPVPQGDTVSSRQGKSFRCTSVGIRGAIVADATAVVNAWGVYLVWDYQPNQALPAITAIFDTISPYSFPNRSNDLRFKIIRKFLDVTVGNSTTPTTEKVALFIDEFVKLPVDSNVLCTSGDTTGVIGNTIMGALYLITMGSGVAGTADANAIISIRVNFTDKNT
jgi:hypothetical protein